VCFSARLLFFFPPRAQTSSPFSFPAFCFLPLPFPASKKKNTGNECTFDVCDAQRCCVSVPVAQGADCDNGIFCDGAVRLGGFLPVFFLVLFLTRDPPSPTGRLQRRRRVRAAQHGAAVQAGASDLPELLRRGHQGMPRAAGNTVRRRRLVHTDRRVSSFRFVGKKKKQNARLVPSCLTRCFSSQVRSGPVCWSRQSVRQRSQLLQQYLRQFPSNVRPPRRRTV
jgi:hypothetical protein